MNHYAVSRHKSDKPQCHVCGSRRQRNLIFFPKFRIRLDDGLEIPYYDKLAYAWKKVTELPFLRRVWDEEQNAYEHEYVCIRCLIHPDHIDVLEDINHFDRQRYGLKPLATYRYKDTSEIAEVLKQRKGMRLAKS